MESLWSFDVVLFLRTWYNFFMDHYFSLWEFFQNYAWTMLFAGLILYYIYKKLISPIIEKTLGTFDNYRKRREEEEYAAKYHKNPDLFAARISAQQEAAQKLQEKYKKEAEEHQKKLQEKLEQKRLEMLENSPGSGQKLGSIADEKSKSKSLRPEYNPLMGAGSGSSYRPPKKSVCGSGGCGK